MIRALLYICAIVAAAIGLSWLADRPGELVINWQGYEIQTSVFRAIVMIALLTVGAIALWSLFRALVNSPANVGQFFRQRRQERGFEALSAGIIAVGSGDRALATRYAALARKSMPNEPLTQLLRAQAAQLRGDRGEARRIYEAMRNNPETELLGLRGLYLEAQHEQEDEAARQYAERAVSLNPRLGWSVESLFEMQCREKDWSGALETLSRARKHDQIDRKVADRRRAVLLTAQAVELEETDSVRALSLAGEAHGLAPDLVPAAAVAGRLLASQGLTPKAARILQRTWKRSPHPDIAAAYAYARVGDSPRDRLKRIKELAQLTPNSDEGQIAVAVAAIDAQEWEDARRALNHKLDGKPSQRICTLMARIEGGQYGDTGKVREWLARAVHAPRDPAWVADGQVASRWAPTSPTTGALDAFVWQEPAEVLERSETDLLIEQLMPETDTASRLSVRADAVEAEEVAASELDARLAAQTEAARARPSSSHPAAASASSGAAATDDGPTVSSLPPKEVARTTKISPNTTVTDVAKPLTGTPPSRAVTLVTPDPSSGGRKAPNGSGVTRMTLAPVDKPSDRDTAKTAVKAEREDHAMRAPDDPGPENGDQHDNRVPMTRFRVPQSR